MNLATKIIINLGLFIGFFFALGFIIIYSKKGEGATSGSLGVILILVFVFTLKVVWKKNNANNNVE
ncbi:hypothetical protein [Arenibacter algicola]|uniref:Uncharacterized protein n=1 Tax=Arenibacter algicola TaxID=616991 RepID=A0A221UTL7_9FLAO|nr:hypothetical protein [Arenibacter algicola]ASO04590.1 hypothetical protein AREALGSMS7_01115 [Arenibacter algicola]